MRFTLLSVILGPICAIIFISCSKKQNFTSTEVHPTPKSVNYTLAETGLPIEDDEFNRYGSAAKKKTVAEILEKYGSPEEAFLIETNIPQTITCKNGTVLKFDENTFVFADNRAPVTGEIKISVTEYLSDADIMFKGLTTTSNGQLIETAGMIYVSASSGNRICEIKNGEYYRIEIPSENKKENMEVFYGEEKNGTINWVDAAARGKFMSSDNYNNYSNMSHFKSIQFEGGIEEMYKYLNQNFIFPDGFINDHLIGTSYVNFTVDHDGQLYKVYTPKQIQTYADKQLVEAFKNSPCWQSNISKGNYKKMMVPVKMKWVYDPSAIPAKLVAESKPNDKRFDAAYEADRYFAVATKLGWINCDRFINRATDRSELFVQLDSSYDATIRVVFTGMRAILGGVRFSEGFSFLNLPEGEPIKIVAVRIKNGITELAIKEHVVDGATITELVFIPADKEKLMEEFSKLNTTKEFASIN